MVNESLHLNIFLILVNLICVTTGDGNCLLHAVSLAMWGIQDTSMLLRRLLYIAVVEDEEHGHIKKRWHKERGLQTEAISGFALTSRVGWSSSHTLKQNSLLKVLIDMKQT